MPDFNDRSGNGGRGEGTVVRLEPLDHPALGSTYHPSVEAAHEAARTQSRNFGGFKYDLHENGKKVYAGGVAHDVEHTETAVAYNKNRHNK